MFAVVCPPISTWDQNAIRLGFDPSPRLCAKNFWCLKLAVVCTLGAVFSVRYEEVLSYRGPKVGLLTKFSHRRDLLES